MPPSATYVLGDHGSRSNTSRRKTMMDEEKDRVQHFRKLDELTLEQRVRRLEKILYDRDHGVTEESAPSITPHELIG